MHQSIRVVAFLIVAASCATAAYWYNVAQQELIEMSNTCGGMRPPCAMLDGQMSGHAGPIAVSADNAKSLRDAVDYVQSADTTELEDARYSAIMAMFDYCKTHHGDRLPNYYDLSPFGAPYKVSGCLK